MCRASLPINNTHVLGLFVATFYHWTVYLIVRRLKLPLGVGILVGALGYVLVMFCVAALPWLERAACRRFFGALVGSSFCCGSAAGCSIAR